ncbi:hypothetical protein JAAARDRAFT_579123 [Jaapia argillacea MUCL 33604]|uniref:Uncharacterized protein n=1 Tax=Jaapia argillacea MUCL 33604 TaxID=933084 RepID=A0A067QCS2_9AGAM|nr:hypothetical protein JAAARDRAFT_579123 [Jaapia argillacea MUCL 33604]
MDGVTVVGECDSNPVHFAANHVSQSSHPGPQRSVDEACVDSKSRCASSKDSDANLDLGGTDAKSSPSPSPGLLRLPCEIIEDISHWVYCNGFDSDWATMVEIYITGGFTDFAFSRNALSAFSQVCWHVRAPVEGILYKLPHLYAASSAYPGRNFATQAGNLHLLLRTLEQRPELCQLVRGLFLDWFPLLAFSAPVIKGIEQETLRLFELCPRLEKLAMQDVPTHLLGRPFHPAISSLALRSLDTLESLEGFTHLTHLFIANVPASPALATPFPPLTTLKLLGKGSALFAQALALCGETVLELSITSTSTLDDDNEPVALYAMSGSNLYTIRLEGLEMLRFGQSPQAVLLRSLTNLQILHVSDHLLPSRDAFSKLPASLRCLTVSIPDKGAHRIQLLANALSHCIDKATRVPTHVEIFDDFGVWRTRSNPRLEPLMDVCGRLGVIVTFHPKSEIWQYEAYFAIYWK